ncbi:MAG: hypothetical protein CBE08_003310 [Euryarchaeota archaeon TMED248]|nr:MAG: hypothetical protein CBE08_003310 [Euryarchaeota archaeon TMED248]
MRVKLLLVLFCLSILMIPSVFSASSVVEMELEESLSESDIGILAGDVSPNGESVLLVGKDGYAREISALKADDRSRDIELLSGRDVDLNDISWHPRGQAALIAGDLGIALRYETSDNSVTLVNGTGSIIGHNLTTVEWRQAGDYAYFGAEDGGVWKFAEGIGFVALDDSRNSTITGISCHRNIDSCVMSTLQDGLAVIGPTHNLTWLSGTSSHTWVDVDCAEPILNECLGFASGLRTGIIKINSIDSTKSSAKNPVQYTTLEGDFTKISRGHDSTSIIILAPFSTVRQYPVDDDAYVQISSEDASIWDPVISGRSISFIWENSFNSGFIITSFGNVISFSPPSEEVAESLVVVIIGYVVVISVPGVILGLIYMNSKTMQNYYAKLRGFDKKKKSRKKS